MKYTKQNIQKKRQILSSEKIRRNSKISLFLFKYAFIISIALIVTGLGLGVGFVRGILKNNPTDYKRFRPFQRIYHNYL